MAGLEKFQGIVMAILVIGILVGAALLAMTSFRDSLTTDSVEYNATNEWVDAAANLSSKAPTAGTLFGVALIIVAVFGGVLYFMGKGAV